MAYVVQQRDIEILKQKSKATDIKIEILSLEMIKLDEIQCEVVDGSTSNNADSDCRRTCSLNLIVRKSSIGIGEDKYFWYDKYVRIYLGVVNTRTQETQWYNQGVFMVVSAGFLFDGSIKRMELSFQDKMCSLTGVRNGQVKGFETQIQIGEDVTVRGVMVDVLTQLAGINNYLIDIKDSEIPYDLSFNTGSTIYSIIAALRDLHPAHETYFDTDGVFVFKQIQTLESDEVVLDETILNPLIISESIDQNFAEVRNVIEVWGSCINADRYAETSTIEEDGYVIELDTFELENNSIIAFKATGSSLNGYSLKVNEYDAFPIIHDDEEETPIKDDEIVSDYSYCVKFKNEKFYFLGQFQVHAEARDVNPDSPFSVDKIGEIRSVLSGGDYDNIYSDDRAQERADYELWKSTRYNDTLTVEIIPIYWLDVNQKVRYQSIKDGTIYEYIIKSIETSLSPTFPTMSVTLIRFYPLYPDIIKGT